MKLKNLTAMMMAAASFATQILCAGPIDTVCYSLSGRPTVAFSYPLRVLIDYQTDGADLAFKANFGIYDPLPHKRMTGGLYAKEAVLEPGHDGLKWGECFPGTYQLCFEPEDREKFFWVNNKPYIGRLLVYQISGKISLVNEVDIEDYVLGLLTHKIAQKEFHPEAFAAMAICARTEALCEAKQKTEGYWHIWAKNTGFIGCDLENFQEALQQAVQKTRGIVLCNDKTPMAIDQSAIDIAAFEKMAQHNKKAPDILQATFPNASLRLLTSL